MIRARARAEMRTQTQGARAEMGDHREHGEAVM